MNSIVLWSLPSLAIVSIAWYLFRRRKARANLLDPETSRLYSDIEPLHNFDWSSKDQIQNVTFKNIFHLTMALQTCSMSELVDMDKTYRNKIAIRRKVLEESFSSVVECNPVAEDAVYELYEWVFGTYLPKRFPSMFSLITTEKGSYVLNKVLDERIPLSPLPSTPLECLRTLGMHVDDEFVILLPNSNANQRHPPRAVPTATPTEPYYLHAYVLVFPSGFNTPKKFGLPLAAIHQPVPGYAQKLEKSMDRFFATLPFGKVVKRSNWACQQDDVWFKLSGNHAHSKLQPGTMAPPKHEPTEDELKQWAKDAEKIVPENCNLRSERQTLHRLEKTGALIFAFKTFMYRLPEVKAAGLGPEMADAAEGMWKGSVPAMALYKRGVVWARKVCDYLRADV